VSCGGQVRKPKTNTRKAVQAKVEQTICYRPERHLSMRPPYKRTNAVHPEGSVTHQVCGLCGGFMKWLP
jgi:hypothetical protein